MAAPATTPSAQAALRAMTQECVLVPMPIDPASASQASTMLPAHEIQTADRVLSPGPRANFLVVRAALRSLLGHCIAEPPQHVELHFGPHGKPCLAAGHRLRFNLSHSGSLALFAFAWDTELGVDVEMLRPMPNLTGIAARFFAPEECEDLQRFAGTCAELPFFQCWTRKEAYVKALGTGIDCPLDGFRVSIDPAQPARLLRLDGGDPALWSLHSLIPCPGYIGALAYRGAPKRLVQCAAQSCTELLA